MSKNSSFGPDKRNGGVSTAPGSAFGHPRDFLGNRFVYVVISPRARGLSIGINMNPDKQCNFDCPYCEVNRALPPRELHLDVSAMANELEKTLAIVQENGLARQPEYQSVPPPLLQLRHVALSGDGEPTLSAHFLEAVETVLHVRARAHFPFFKIVLITNSSGLEQPAVQQGLKFFTKDDEVWVKLDGGTEGYLQKVNASDVPMEKILKNILDLARRRPVTIQSLFFSLDGQDPPEEEICQYALRLKELKEGGAQIPLVQIYSATRPHFSTNCGHVPLPLLSHIAKTVRQVSGLEAEVF